MEATVKPASEALARWVLIAAGLVTTVHAAASLTLPFGWDHGMMAAVGESYVHGKLPYSDSWDMKGPISYTPYALAHLLFGPTMWGVRLFDLILTAIASFAFYRGLRALTDWRTGAWGALALYYWVASTGWFFTAAPEPWTDALCILAIVPLAASAKAPAAWRFAFSGLLIGCVGLIKPLYLGVGLAPLLVIAFARDVSLTRRAGMALGLALGALAPILIAVVYFQARGGLAQAIEVHILYPFSTYAAVRTGGKTMADGFAEFFSRPTVALLAPFAVLGVRALWRRPQTLWPAVAWLAVMILSVAAQGKYFPAHWIPVYAPFVFLAAPGAYALARVSPKAPLLIAIAAALTFTAEVCAAPLHDAAKAAYYFIVKRDPDAYYATFQVHIYNAGDELAAARYVKAHTRPDEGVFVWGNDATVRYLADRPNPTRFTFEMPLSLPGPYLEPYRAEAMRRLLANPPTYFIVGVNWWAGDSQAESLAKFPQMDAFLRDHYTLEKSFGVLQLYRLRPTAAGAAAVTSTGAVG